MKPLLYTIVPQDTLQSMVDTFYACISLPIQIIDKSGEFLSSSGPKFSFCLCFEKFLPKEENCEKMYISASKKAISLGEPYIFACHAELNHIIFPLIHKKTFLGSILVGPFLMDAADSILISDLVRKYNIPTESALELYDNAGSIPLVLPAKVNHISRLLYYLFANLIDGSKEELKQNNQKLLQQSLINESIQRYKSEEIHTDSYPYEKEKDLLHKVKLGNALEANAVLNDLLGYVLFSEGSSLEVVKARAIELSSLLSRTAIEGGAPTDSILKLNNQFLKNIQQIHSLETLCFHLQEIVVTFSESMFGNASNPNSELIRKAMIYISKHFNEPLTLEEVALHVHLHPSYFSTIFKQSIGSTFKEYLNMVRIEESKRLLSNTDFSIIDIAVAIGFEDQSYFSKVFKKYTGLTPKQYR
ncbi:PocR ligand-binding domain-containing protein [Lachnospiraceae bacterium OttesenSCG-928-D06]|nr:PocR ligand-binding domain-containing protein [Lachnospiraceae bacterium OttesenSCG-928-D06]